MFDIGVPIRNLILRNCIGKLYINDEKKCLECKVEELDINIYDYVDATCAFLGLPEFIRNKIVDGMKKKVVESIPPIVLSPTVFELDIKLIDWKVNIEGRKRTITNHEAIVGAYLYFKELQDVTVPNDNDPYIGVGSEFWFKQVLALRFGYTVTGSYAADGTYLDILRPGGTNSPACPHLPA